MSIILIKNDLLDITPIFGEIISELNLRQSEMQRGQYFYLSLFVI